MSVEEFKEQAEEWMREFGYTGHFHTSDYKTLGFWNTNDPEDYPGVTCEFNNGEPTVEISDVTSYKMGLSLSSGKMSFKNPLFEKTLNIVRHHGRLARQNPPF